MDFPLSSYVHGSSSKGRIQLVQRRLLNALLTILRGYNNGYTTPTVATTMAKPLLYCGYYHSYCGYNNGYTTPILWLLPLLLWLQQWLPLLLWLQQ